METIKSIKVKKLAIVLDKVAKTGQKIKVAPPLGRFSFSYSFDKQLAK